VADVAPLENDIPDDLGEAGAELWVAITSAAQPWLARSDMFALHMLCELYDRRAEYKQVLVDHGTLIQRPIDGHLVANPAATLLIQTEKQITDLASSLGLTPADRTRMGLAEVKAKNAFEDLLAKRRNQ
jgi:P27 family predicted phage terminase small subunit